MITITEHQLTFKGTVDEGKTLAEELSQIQDSSTTLSDFIFQLEVAYQSYYNLEQDNWGRII